MTQFMPVLRPGSAKYGWLALVLSTTGPLWLDVPVKAIGYTRVSTEGQAESGLGLEAQREAIEADVKRRGWELVAVVEDAGEGGGDVDRPGLRKALERIADGEAEALVVAKLDRLSRSAVHTGQLLDWFKEAGATFVAMDLGVDTSTASGMLVANVLASVAQWERDAIGERTAAALRAKKARGEPIGRPAIGPKCAWTGKAAFRSSRRCNCAKELRSGA